MLNIDTRLLESDLTPNELAVLLHIAKRINVKNSSFPSVKLLQKEVKIGRDSVMKAVKSLTDKGLIEKSQMKPIKGKNRFGSNLYTLKTPYLSVYVPLTGSTVSLCQGTEIQGTEIQGTENQGTENQSTEIQGTEKSTLSISKKGSINKERSINKENSDFLNFWNSYPRKEAKPTAQKAFNALTPEQQEKAIKGIEGFVSGKEPKYILSPRRYLEEERWEDEKPAPEQPKQKVRLQDKMDSVWESMM